MTKTDVKDTWPHPNFDPGPPKHLHAIGVIAITFAQLEETVGALFLDKASDLKIPDKLAELYFYNLDESKKSEAIKLIFSEKFESDETLSKLVYNLVDCLRWARDCRNNILHAEKHPITNYHHDTTLYLTKRMGKRSSVPVFIPFELEQLRAIANKTRSYVKRSIQLKLFLRYRKVAIEQLDPHDRAYATLPSDPLPIEAPIKPKQFPISH